MATTEEKVELVETLKGPRFYNIQLNGYGGESAYMTVSKEAHDFWQPLCEKHGDYDLTTYMNSDGEEEDEYDNIESVPPEAQFLHDQITTTTSVLGMNLTQNLNTHMVLNGVVHT